MRSDIVIKPAVAQDIVDLMGRGLPHTCRAWSVFLDGELVCVAGVMRTKRLMVAFSEIKEGVEVSDRTVWETAVLLWRKIKGLGYSSMYALASPRFPNASGFLTRLGWKHIESTARGEVYEWQIQ